MLGYRSSSELYIKHLKKIGGSVGNLTKIYSPMTTLIDETRPHLLYIGDRVRITSGVKILTHDFSYSVCRPVFHDLINDHVRPTIIGNNVFLGVNSIVLPGVKIGDNCIIGAGAVVSMNIPDNSVVVGNPAKVVSSLSEFYEKRRKSAVADAFALANLWREKKGEEPTVKEMSTFWWLFLKRDKKELERYGVNPKFSCDNTEEIMEDFFNSQPIFDSFDDFLNKSKVDSGKI